MVENSGENSGDGLLAALSTGLATRLRNAVRVKTLTRAAIAVASTAVPFRTYANPLTLGENIPAADAMQISAEERERERDGHLS